MHASKADGFAAMLQPHRMHHDAHSLVWRRHWPATETRPTAGSVSQATSLLAQQLLHNKGPDAASETCAAASRKIQGLPASDCSLGYVLFIIDGTWQEAKEIHKVHRCCATRYTYVAFLLVDLNSVQITIALPARHAVYTM